MTTHTPAPLALPSLLARDPDVLERFLQTLGDALYVVDADKRIVYWNRQAEQLTGYAAAEVLGKPCLSGVDCENCRQACRLFETGVVDDARVVIKARDGHLLHVRKSAFVLRDAEGGIIGGIELLRDETELMERIASCREQRRVIEDRERLQSAILGSIQEGVATIDREWRITSFSRRAEVLTGHRAEDAIGRFCHEVLPSALCQQGCPALHCLETGAAEAEQNTEILTAAGQPLPIAEKAIPLLDEQGEAIGSVLVIEDRSAFGMGAVDGGESASFCGIVGRSEAMRRVFHVIEQVARTDVSVLLTGESGTGKEMAARAIHRRSGRRAGPLQAINCAALPETLLESELFGHVRGAFTGAERDRSGRIAEAEHGSLFLDEVGEMPLSIQAKLLRFLQEREYQRVGESKTRSADVRIICATNRDLKAEVTAGRFREDLYYRIRVIPIELPPLRDRRGDIPLLAQSLLLDIAVKRGRPDLVWTPAAIRALTDHAWPGNVRELVNAIEYAVALAPGRKLGPEDLPPEVQDAPPLPRIPPSGGADDEKARILETLRTHGGNRTQAARALGMDRVTLYRKLKKWGE